MRFTTASDDRAGDPGGDRGIAEFRLKRFFNDDLGPAAADNLSPSYCEPLTIGDLLAMRDHGAEELGRLSLGYPGIHGSQPLRALIARRYDRLSAEHILVLNGVDDALSLIFLSCVEPGDHVVVHAPGYQPFTALARWRGAGVSLWQARESAGWALDLDELPTLIQPTTRLIVVNLPHNPTGYVMPVRERADLLRLADERGITVLCDEIYEGLDLDSIPSGPKAADLSPRAVSLSGLSKNVGLPGLRIGWIATANREALDAAKRLRMHLNTFVSAPSEFLAGIVLENSAAILARNRAIARENLSLLTAFMDKHRERLTWHAPMAVVSAFPRLLGPRTAEAFCAAVLARTGILLAPGPLFDADNHHFRIGFGVKSVPGMLVALDAHLSRSAS